MRVYLCIACLAYHNNCPKTLPKRKLSKNFVANVNASWLLRTNVGMDENEGKGNTGWPNDVDPSLMGFDTRYLWKIRKE
jgi:hypothetical protein